MLIFNKTRLLEKFILKTRKHFISINNECINDVKSGKLIVNDPNLYIKNNLNEIKKINDGDFDNCFTFMQHTYYLQTGECVGMFSK